MRARLPALLVAVLLALAAPPPSACADPGARQPTAAEIAEVEDLIRQGDAVQREYEAASAEYSRLASAADEPGLSAEERAQRRAAARAAIELVVEKGRHSDALRQAAIHRADEVYGIAPPTGVGEAQFSRRGGASGIWGVNSGWITPLLQIGPGAFHSRTEGSHPNYRLIPSAARLAAAKGFLYAAYAEERRIREFTPPPKTRGRELDRWGWWFNDERDLATLKGYDWILANAAALGLSAEDVNTVRDRRDRVYRFDLSEEQRKRYDAGAEPAGCEGVGPASVPEQGRVLTPSGWGAQGEAVAVSVVGTGTTHALSVRAFNAAKEPVALRFPAGVVFETVDRTVQPMMTAVNRDVVLAIGAEATFPIRVVCLDRTRRPPAPKDTMSVVNRATRPGGVTGLLPEGAAGGLEAVSRALVAADEVFAERLFFHPVEPGATVAPRSGTATVYGDATWDATPLPNPPPGPYERSRPPKGLEAPLHVAAGAPSPPAESAADFATVVRNWTTWTLTNQGGTPDPAPIAREAAEQLRASGVPADKADRAGAQAAGEVVGAVQRVLDRRAAGDSEDVDWAALDLTLKDAAG